MKQFLHLVSLLRPFLGEILLSILLGIAAIGAGIGLLGTSAWLIASAALHPSIAELQIAIVGVRFFGISRGFFRYLERLTSHSVNLNLLSNLREDFYRRIEPGAPANLHPYRSGDLLDRVMGDLEVLQNFYVRVVAPVIVAVVVTAGMSLFAGGYAAGCGIILAAGLVINGLLLPAGSILISRPITERITNIRVEISSATVEVLQGLEDLQAYNVQERWFGKIEGENRKAGQAQEQLNLVNAAGSGIYLLVVSLTLLGIMWFAIPLVNSQEMSGVALAVLIMAAGASFEATASLPSAASNLNSSLASARRLFSIDGTAQSSVEIGHCEPGGQELKIEKLSFSYTGNSPVILREVNLDLKRGQRKALVGVSGAGKTSLLNLLLGFQTSYTGKILVDGCEINNIDRAYLHRIFGVVPQSIYIFNASLRENLLLAKESASDEEICRALALVQLERWLKNLPQGLDTWLGEHGMKMSAGERQRLAAARIVLQDPPMVLLDEPTANLDPINETNLLDNLFSLFQDKGILLITHKLHLLEQMDEIILLHHSTIAEHGSYTTLMNRDGLFSRLAKLEDDRLMQNEDN